MSYSLDTEITLPNTPKSIYVNVYHSSIDVGCISSQADPIDTDKKEKPKLQVISSNTRFLPSHERKLATSRRELTAPVF